MKKQLTTKQKKMFLEQELKLITEAIETMKSTLLTLNDVNPKSDETKNLINSFQDNILYYEEKKAELEAKLDTLNANNLELNVEM